MFPNLRISFHFFLKCCLFIYISLEQGFFSFKYLFIYYVYNILSVCMSAGQKRAPDLITDGCEPPCGYWELNSGPLEEQAMLLTTEPSLQPLEQGFLTLVVTARFGGIK